jgi:DNA-binding beta-propeller fold protein YncE
VWLVFPLRSAEGGERRGTRAPLGARARRCLGVPRCLGVSRHARARAFAVLVLAVPAVGGLCGGVAHAADLTALVANNGGDKNFGSLAPVDIATNTLEVWSPSGGPNPTAIAFTPDGNSAWVANETAEPEGHGYLEQVLVAGHTGGIQISTIYDPWAIAIAPDGETAYVVNREGSQGGIVPVALAGGAVGTEIQVAKAYAIAIAPDGSKAYVLSSYGEEAGWVTPIELPAGTAGTAIPVGKGPRAIAIAPDGATAYVVNAGETPVTVTPVDLSTGKAGTVIKVPETVYADGLAVAPDGSSAYVAVQESSGSAQPNADAIVPIDLAAGEAGTPIPDGESNEPPGGVAISPDAKTVYVAEQGGLLVPVGLAPAGAETPINVIGGYPTPDTLAVAIQPDQAPTAAFETTPAPPHEPTKFDGSASTAPFGSIASYEWEFGDGSANEITAEPKTTYVYTEPKTYTAKLTVTDSSGTSTTKVYTGQMMLRNGGPSAVVEHSVVIGGAQHPEVKLSKTSLVFGDVEIGQTGGPETITVENSGSAELAIKPGGVLLAGADPAAFKLSADGCSGKGIAGAKRAASE